MPRTEPDPEEWYCDECGVQIDSARAGCQNPHCGETPHERRLRLLREESEDDWS
jgi:hypothetical protein